ncbi:hypothetical protein [Glycomyces tenuis]|uniref:hypothetical protein n=1 Tax=Glycomyces tenuis TaxID=58116 RepID=UPI00041AD6ED|nr:hypothetical protein [Glycomyces tenuis]
MKLDIDALAARKLLAVAGTGLIGLVGLAACGSDDGGAESDAETSTVENGAGGEDTAAEGEAPAEDAAADTCEIAPAEDGAGTDFASPLERCAAGAVGAWDVAVTEVELDATDTILEANAFNEEPADGSQYLMFTLTGTNNGDAAADPFMDLWMAVDFNDFRYEDTCGVLPNDLVDVGEVAPGESFTANGCVFVDSAGVEEAVLALSSLSSAESTETYYQLG